MSAVKVKGRVQRMMAPVLILDGSPIEHARAQCAKAINEWDIQGIFNEGEEIAKSDWYVDKGIKRPYYDHMKVAFDLSCVAISSTYDIAVKDLHLDNYWFQQYEIGNFHNWHIHQKCAFNCVWYVDLPEDAKAVEMRGMDGDILIDAKQGDIVIFPSCYVHRSAPNESSGTKTAVAFNI